MPETPKPAAAGTNHRTHRLREFVLLTLGVITPVGILAVNASAFVMVHLDAFRIVIAGCALLSGLVLNGLTAWWLLRLASLHAPPLFREYRTWVIGAAVIIVLLTAGGGGYLTYLGMPPPPRFFSSGTSVTIASVVSTIAAIDAAFCSAERVTLAGSTMPASNMFTNLSLSAS